MKELMRVDSRLSSDHPLSPRTERPYKHLDAVHRRKRRLWDSPSSQHNTGRAILHGERGMPRKCRHKCPLQRGLSRLVGDGRCCSRAIRGNEGVGVCYCVRDDLGPPGHQRLPRDGVPTGGFDGVEVQEEVGVGGG